MDITNSEIKLISVEEGCIYTLKDFGSIQAVAVSNAQQLLHSLREEIVGVITSACQVGVSIAFVELQFMINIIGGC